MLGYGVLASCAGARQAAGGMTSRAKLDNAIVLRIFFIDFSWDTPLGDVDINIISLYQSQSMVAKLTFETTLQLACNEMLVLAAIGNSVGNCPTFGCPLSHRERKRFE